jgi:hypothetical protein
MNSDLHFPIPPFQVDRLHIDTSFEEIARYLARVRSWRAAVLGFISRPYTEGLGETEGLTERARKALETFLASEWPKSMKNYAIQSPYNITSFPLSATEVAANSTVESVLEVIRWRAGVVDYLDDVWDVIGDPFLNLDECQALDRFLHPAESPPCHSLSGRHLPTRVYAFRVLDGGTYRSASPLMGANPRVSFAFACGIGGHLALTCATSRQSCPPGPSKPEANSLKQKAHNCFALYLPNSFQIVLRASDSHVCHAFVARAQANKRKRSERRLSVTPPDESS